MVINLITFASILLSLIHISNMHEIRQLTGHGLDYLSVEELQALLSPGFDILHAEEEVISLPLSLIHISKIQLLYQDENGNVSTKFPAGYTIGYFIDRKSVV